MSQMPQAVVFTVEKKHSSVLFVSPAFSHWMRSRNQNEPLRFSEHFRFKPTRTRSCGASLTGSWRTTAGPWTLCWSSLIITPVLAPLWANVMLVNLKHSECLFLVVVVFPFYPTSIRSKVKMVQFDTVYGGGKKVFFLGNIR